MVGLIQQMRTQPTSASPLHPVLRNRVQKILMSAECQAIDFTFGSVHIDGSGYTYVALALISKNEREGGLNIVTDDDGKQMPANAGAAYMPRQNKFLFKDENVGLNALSRGDIVHECTHALVDARNDNIGDLTDETCAYIAQAMYNLNLQHPAPPPTPIRREAHKIAAKVKARRQAYNFTDTYTLYPADVAQLQAAILASPTYTDIDDNPYTNGGVPLSPP